MTGIEGSRHRWEAHGDNMARAVGEHDRIVRDVVERSGGHLVRQIGDGVLAVFRSAEVAIATAVSIQAALVVHDWSPVPPLRVRIGVHTGWSEPIGSGYVGAVVNRARHVADAGHGGQVLVSASAAATLSPPEGFAFVSRGVHRLKDLAEPFELVQVIGPHLETELVPLRSLGEGVACLPMQRNQLFGRERELREAAALLKAHRLITLCGPGGVGKTRLAIQIAAESADGFANGVLFADLSSARAGDDLAAVMRDQVSSGSPHDHTSISTFDGLVRRIDRTDVLLTVDNCEHVIDAAALLLERLMLSCRHLKILVTSRARLHLSGEQVFHIDPLAPYEGSIVLDDPAVELFIDCSVAMGCPAPTPAQLSTVVRICALVDRLPLGIELAAARVAYLPLDDLLARLEDHYVILVGRDRSTADRHRTIDALLRWSHDTLQDNERLLFERLGVFAASVDLAAIENVCSDDALAHGQILEAVAALVDRSLLRHNADSGRYDVLNLIRTFAREQLTATGQLQTLLDRHTLWCLSVVRSATGSASGEAAERLRARYGIEIGAALDRAITAGDAEVAWELAGGVWRSFEGSGRAREGIDLLRRAAAVSDAKHSLSWASVSQGLASLLLTVGEVDEALCLLQEAVQLGEEFGDPPVTTRARSALSMALLFAGREGALEAAEQALHEFEQMGDRRGGGYALSALGFIAAKAGDGATAERHYLSALAAFRTAHERRDAAAVLSNLGNLAHDRHNLLRATRYFDGARQLYDEIEDRRGLALVLNNLALIALERRDLDRAESLAIEAEALFDRLGDRPGQGAAQLNLANVAAESGRRAEALARYSRAIDTFRAAREVRGVLMGLENLSEIAWSWGARSLGWRCALERAAIQLHLGLHAGLQMTLLSLADRADASDLDGLAERLRRLRQPFVTHEIEAILAEAGLAAPVDPETQESAEALAPPTVDELTNREREIISQLSEGRTNGEIAATLYISQRTVDAHLSHIRTKLGVTDRVKLAVSAREYLARRP